MVKLIVAYKKPADADEFERRYKDEHVALARGIPHMAKIEFSKVAGTPDGSPAPYHRIAELYFDDMAPFGKALATDDGKKAAGHAMEIATGGLDMMIVEVDGGGA